MDPNEFPTLEEAVSGNDNNNKTNDAGHVDKSTGLSSSWAEVAQPNQDKNNSDASSEPPKPELQPNHDNKSFATVAGHEKKQAEEFPTPQESLNEADTSSVPASAGVSDLLNNATPITQDTTEPPNPDRSFADVASNKDFPTPEHDKTQEDNDQPPLSDLPDVKDMLQQPSVHVPPVPASQSFAKVATKEIPPEKRPLSERAQAILNQKPEEEDPMTVNDDNFPTLGQSNLMAQENAGEDEKAVYSEISRLNQVNEDDTIKEQKDPKLKKSFADITSSNLENAPPPAVSHVDQLPVYDEETVYLENAKREGRKNVQVPVGNNEQLIEQEELNQVQPTHEQKKQEKKNEKTYQKSREVVSGGKQKEEEEEETDQMLVRLHTFDRSRTGKITIFNTMAALYRLGYSWFTIIPGAILMHLCLSPMTSPYGVPFIYRSLSDLILLPVYTRNLSAALKYNTPMQDKEQVQKMVKTYGHQKGLGFWDGIKAIRHSEQGHLRWWQLGLWAIHRIQWTLTYTMLHEPKSNVVSESTLVSLVSSK